MPQSALFVLNPPVSLKPISGSRLALPLTWNDCNRLRIQPVNATH